ncbi:MAG: hypothetical protein GAK30_03572 [Paracidovorax wautersii]|uniref:HIT domain-containing protein n=1 Tax=Paracidovorax wautersii TaxID=1177982 RepID=A0A7V8FL06_9BURK|nr:MAG: hypothetical protein GAK30_03572 [Paracidovorax wautersii]
MSTAPDCKYCAQPPAHDMPLIATLRCADLFLLPDARHPGRCVLALHRHCTELFQLSRAEQAAWMHDLADAAQAIQAATGCDKINHAAYGDVFQHLHFHLVPKHAQGPQWGQPFELQPAAPTGLDIRGLCEALRQALPTCAATQAPPPAPQ